MASHGQNPFHSHRKKEILNQMALNYRLNIIFQSIVGGLLPNYDMKKEKIIKMSFFFSFLKALKNRQSDIINI